MRKNKIKLSNYIEGKRGVIMSDYIEPIVKLWVLRILVPLERHRVFIMESGFSNEGVASNLGLEKWINCPSKKFDGLAIRKQLYQSYEEETKKASEYHANKFVTANIKMLSQLIGLNDIDCKILTFVIYLHNEKVLDEAVDWFSGPSRLRVVRVLAGILDLPEKTVSEALQPNGLLSQSGLLKINRTGLDFMICKLEMLSDSFSDAVYSTKICGVDVLKGMVSQSTPPVLSITDYSYIENELELLIPYLKNSLETERSGVNIFIHGQPGTGKNQLIKAIGSALGVDVFEVATEDDQGNPITGERRLQAYRAAQCFFIKNTPIILFDEVEDVFSDGNLIAGKKSTAQIHKGWINRTLEENKVPTIWLSNDINCLDHAFIRRFDLIIELTIPPKSQRKRIMKKYCSDLLPEAQMEHIAGSEHLAPAIIERAAHVVGLISDDIGKEKAAEAVKTLVSSTLKAQGYKPIRSKRLTFNNATYNPAFINADCDITVIADGLKEQGAGRLCLYGPPGTGKTAYGHWLAEQLDRPLLVKRASDLISMWVGGTEANIAKAFEEATKEGAVLLIDEVDSFLQDRRQAARSWEVTEVNEMLTQMESFEGVFVASTNLMEGLDQAALRRFDLKAHFDFLSAEQSVAMMIEYCSVLGIQAPNDRALAGFKPIVNLTPGDFAALHRRSRFQPIQTSVQLLELLQKECGFKDGKQRPMGFLQ